MPSVRLMIREEGMVHPDTEPTRCTLPVVEASGRGQLVL